MENKRTEILYRNQIDRERESESEWEQRIIAIIKKDGLFAGK